MIVECFMKMSIPISDQKERECYQQMISDDGFKYARAKKIDHRVQTFLPKSSQISENESKIIFVNPERFNISTMKKSVTPRRLVISSNVRSEESNSSSSRKVFINPNFEQPFSDKVFKEPCQENLFSNQHFQASIESQKPRNSLNINIKQFVAKKSLGNVKTHLPMDYNNLSNQPSQTVVKAKSCYINPHFKGVLRQEGVEQKKDILKPDVLVSQRIVGFGRATANEKSSVIQINTSKTSTQNPFQGNISSKSSLNLKAEAFLKSGKLKNNENEQLSVMKLMKNTLPSPQREKLKISRNVDTLPKNLYSKNVDTKNETCASEKISSCGEPTKIYFNKEKLKKDITKMNTILLNMQESRLPPGESSSKSATKELSYGRNIFVNPSLLVKRLKETDLKNSVSASTSDFVTQKLNCADLLKENQAIVNPTKIMSIKPSALKQRKRSSSSTCLISISKTKMIRKKKAPVQVSPFKPVKKNLPQYFNNLKRLEIARTGRNARQVMQPILRNNQFTDPNKMSIRRRQGFVWSINNLVPTNPNYQKNKMIKINRNIRSVTPRNKFGFKKSKYYLNRTKVNKLSTAKIRPLKTLSTNKSNESVSKGGRKLVKSNSSLLILSPTKLVRKKLPSSQQILTPHKTLSSVQIARIIKSKYKFNRNVSVLKKSLLNGNKISSNRKSRKNEIRSQNIFGKRKIHLEKSSIVNIGGVFYKATHNKLTRNSSISSKALNNKGPILQVRGQRFSLDKTGRTLKSLDTDARVGINKLKRVDIGGVTFIQSKQGTSLVRTNTHNARTRLIQAKQRSITLLTKNLRKNNEPCPLYHRFGRCIGKERGTCNRIHNAKNIAVCKKFVQGKCENANCLLSHAMGPEKMPTCYHYLAGNCVRDNCPYLHVKVNSKAPVCVAFLQGYCADGDKCMKRHKDVCPEFEEKGTCAKGKFCPYPHPKKKKSPKPKAAAVEKVVIEVPKEVSTFRYFDDEQCHEDIKETESVQETMDSDKSEEISDWLIKRPKLGMLPAFIPLNMD